MIGATLIVLGFIVLGLSMISPVYVSPPVKVLGTIAASILIVLIALFA